MIDTHIEQGIRYLQEGVRIDSGVLLVPVPPCQNDANNLGEKEREREKNGKKIKGKN